MAGKTTRKWLPTQKVRQLYEKFTSRGQKKIWTNRAKKGAGSPETPVNQCPLEPTVLRIMCTAAITIAKARK